MFTARFRFLQLLASLAILVGTVSSARAVGWFDDFNDGNAEDGSPVTWTYNEIGFTPGTYDASSGDYSLSAPGNFANDDTLAASVDVNFTDTYVRTQGVVQPGTLPDETGGNLLVIARWNPFSFSGYVLYLDDGGQFALLRVDGGGITDLAFLDPIDVNAATDVMLELDVVGDQFSAYAWLPGDPKPATPLMTAIDATYASGRAGIGYNEDDDNTAGVFRFAAAQDTPFIDALPGDFNGDGKVDAADYPVWRDGLGTTYTQADYDVWTANFGAGAAAGSVAAAVPEPTGLVSVLLAIVALARIVGGRRLRRGIGGG